jgi:HSP20 family molecular chaperone IbpA
MRLFNLFFDSAIDQFIYSPVAFSVNNNEIKLELPGIGKDNIKVHSLNNDTIKVSWKTKQGEKETEDYRLFEDMPHKEATSEYKDGILIVKLNPPEENKKEIEVK